MNDLPLSLHEEVLLLALRDTEGTVATPMYTYAIGGAVLAELLMRGRVAVSASGGKALADVVDASPTGELLLDECLAQIAGSGKPKTLESWVGRFASIRDLKHRVAQPLCERGILRRDEGTLLLVFSRTIYPEADARPEHDIVERLRVAVFSDGPDVEARTTVLLSLADKAGLLPLVFDKKELKSRRARIDAVTTGEMTGPAARQAIHAAVLVASLLPAVVVATTSAH